MTDRYHITLLRNQYLELRQIRLKSSNTVAGYEIARTPLDVHYFSVSQPFVTVFSNITAWLACLGSKTEPMNSLKQLDKGRTFQRLLTGQQFAQPYDLPRYPRRIRSDRSLPRGMRGRDTVGRDHEKRLVGRTRGLGTTTQVVNASTVSEPDTAPNCLKPHPLPGKQRISYPLAAGDKRKRGPRGGGGRVPAGRRRRDRSDPLEKIFRGGGQAATHPHHARVDQSGGAEAVSADGLDRGGVKEEGSGMEP